MSLLELETKKRWVKKFSKSQRGQDWFVMQLFRKKNGFFVEFGAVNGILNSNTYSLEKIFGWRGILAEPAKKYSSSLMQNRSCSIDFDCVYNNTGQKVEFVETRNWADGNTIKNFLDVDGKTRVAERVYEVKTISLADLLLKYSAPRYIDFLSIDTEGSEFEILEAFEFSAFSFGAICIEHNDVEYKRRAIQQILTDNGYARLDLPRDMCGVDDWYLDAEMIKEFSRIFL